MNLWMFTRTPDEMFMTHRHDRSKTYKSPLTLDS